MKTVPVVFAVCINMIAKLLYIIIFSEFCDGSLIDKGFGYNPYLPDCSKFIQCFPSGPDFKAVIRDCPHGEFWSQKHVTCIASSDVNCRNGMHNFICNDIAAILLSRNLDYAHSVSLSHSVTMLTQ